MRHNTYQSEIEEQEIYRQHFGDDNSDGGDSDQEDVDRNEKLVVRIIPKAVDYAIGFL